MVHNPNLVPMVSFPGNEVATLLAIRRRPFVFQSRRYFTIWTTLSAKPLFLVCLFWSESFVNAKQRTTQNVSSIAQFRYFKIQPKTIEFTTRLRGINPTNSIVWSPEPRPEVYCFRLNFNISKLGYQTTTKR